MPRSFICRTATAPIPPTADVAAVPTITPKAVIGAIVYGSLSKDRSLRAQAG
jgi:hypothetical protein